MWSVTPESKIHKSFLTMCEVVKDSKLKHIQVWARKRDPPWIVFRKDFSLLISSAFNSPGLEVAIDYVFSMVFSYSLVVRWACAWFLDCKFLNPHILLKTVPFPCNLKHVSLVCFSFLHNEHHRPSRFWLRVKIIHSLLWLRPRSCTLLDTIVDLSRLRSLNIVSLLCSLLHTIK